LELLRRFEMPIAILYNFFEMTSQNASQNSSLLDNWVWVLDLRLPVSPHRFPRAMHQHLFSTEKPFGWQLPKVNLHALVPLVRSQAL
jgi:hypothetical protein